MVGNVESTSLIVTRRTYGLSKSKLLSWLQCPKRLWLETHRPEIAAPREGVEQLFTIGHDVGRLAQRLQRSGVLIGSQDNLSNALAETSAQVAAGTDTLFEPTFQYGDVLVRVDILKRRKNGYQIREVKASASVKDHHLQDAAIQAWVLHGAGVKVNSVRIQHINTRFVYPGGQDYRGLFVQQGVGSEIRALTKDVPKWVAEAQGTLAGHEPKREVGKHCHKPYDCPYLDHCAPKEQRTEYPLSILRFGAMALAKLVAEGYRDVRDIPAERITEKQNRIWRVSKSGKWELDPTAKTVMSKFPYPRYHLDFETIGFPIPIWPGTRPYQQVPFQFSCHIERGTGEPEHQKYLDTTGNPPMQGIADALVDSLGDNGPIFSHNAKFEQGRLEDLAKLVPQRARQLRTLIARSVDTLTLTKSYYYHPAMKGSWSLKALLPTVAPELDYQNVGEVQKGGEVAAAYVEIVSADTSNERKAELRAALERYCERDTLATLRITRFLETGNSGHG